MPGPTCHWIKLMTCTWVIWYEPHRFVSLRFPLLSPLGTTPPPSEYSKLAIARGGGGGQESLVLNPNFFRRLLTETRNINMWRANQMSRADSRMMLVFGGFASKPETLTFEESLIFVKKVKARDYMLYLSLFDILGRMDLSQLEAYQELQLLFRNHPDLHEELEKFRPPVPIKQATNNIWPWVFVCAVPLVAVSLMPALGNPVLWLVQQTIGEKMTA